MQINAYKIFFQGGESQKNFAGYGFPLDDK